MRVPISRVDIDQSRLTKVARILRKLWPSGPLTLMQAQGLLSRLFGYRDLHDLHRCAVGPEHMKASALSRAQIVQSVSWNIFRLGSVSLNTANAMACKLHLNSLEIDRFTTEAQFDRLQNASRQDGKLLVFDELGYYMDTPWDKRIPALIDAGLPPYQYVIFPDRRVFSWRKLETLLSCLPGDLVERLRGEVAYSDVPVPNLETQFIVRELYPQALVELIETIKMDRILARGYKILLVFNGDGQCVGRVLYNEAIGGLIPAVYGVDDDGLYEAIAALLCGDLLLPELASGHECNGGNGELPGQSVYVSTGFQRGWDVAQDLYVYDHKHSAGNAVDVSRLVALPLGIRFAYGQDGGLLLAGPTCVEAGQPYIRYQPNLLSLDDVPPVVASLSPLLSAPVKDAVAGGYVGSEDVCPPAAVSFHAQAGKDIKGLFAQSSAHLRSSGGIVGLKTLISSVVDPFVLNAYFERLVQGYFDQDDDIESDEMPRLLNDIKADGRSIKDAMGEHIGGLDDVSDAGVALMWLLAQGEYPGSRNSYWANEAKPRDLNACVRILSMLVMHAVSCRVGRVVPEKWFDLDVLCFATDLVMRGQCSDDDLMDLVGQVQRYVDKLKQCGEFLNGLESSRHQDVLDRQLRSEGKFLLLLDPVARQEPPSFASLVSSARSNGFVMPHQHANENVMRR